MTFNDVYEATWEERYLEGAARLTDWALKWEHPVRGGFLAPITEAPAYYSGSSFCGGVLTAALLQFNGWARLPEIDAVLDRAARWTLTDVWQPGGGIMSKGGSATPRQFRLGATYLFAHAPDVSAIQNNAGPAVPRASV